MPDALDHFETRRRKLCAEATARLESALPGGTPDRGSGRRRLDHVLIDHLTIGDVRAALYALDAGPGGELRPSAKGNIAFCSAESSALMTVNFLGPLRSLLL
jgi:hypothetical protein